MKPDWYQLARFQAHPGANAEAAVRTFIEEWFDKPRKWQWVKAEDGTFKLDDGETLYRVRISGAAGNFFVVEWFKKGGPSCVS